LGIADQSNVSSPGGSADAIAGCFCLFAQNISRPDIVVHVDVVSVLAYPFKVNRLVDGACSDSLAGAGTWPIGCAVVAVERNVMYAAMRCSQARP
jgi:hypothetical protein